MLRDGKSPGRGRREAPNTTDIAKRRIGRETGCEKSPASHEQQASKKRALLFVSAFLGYGASILISHW